MISNTLGDRRRQLINIISRKLKLVLENHRLTMRDLVDVVGKGHLGRVESRLVLKSFLSFNRCLREAIRKKRQFLVFASR